MAVPACPAVAQKGAPNVLTTPHVWVEMAMAIRAMSVITAVVQIASDVQPCQTFIQTRHAHTPLLAQPAVLVQRL